MFVFNYLVLVEVQITHGMPGVQLERVQVIVGRHTFQEGPHLIDRKGRLFWYQQEF